MFSPFLFVIWYGNICPNLNKEPNDVWANITRVSRTMKTSRWNIRLERNDLLWRPTDQTPLWKEQRIISLEPLLEFESLGSAFSPDKALEFAQQWGPLGICRCDRFFHHGAEFGWGLEGDATLR